MRKSKFAHEQIIGIPDLGDPLQQINGRSRASMSRGPGARRRRAPRHGEGCARRDQPLTAIDRGLESRIVGRANEFAPATHAQQNALPSGLASLNFSQPGLNQGDEVRLNVLGIALPPAIPGATFEAFTMGTYSKPATRPEWRELRFVY